jgi:hypothetical protein
MKCPCCEGKKGWSEDYGEGTILWDKCPICHATGKVGFMIWFWGKAPARWVELVGDFLDWRHKNESE